MKQIIILVCNNLKEEHDIGMTGLFVITKLIKFDGIYLFGLPLLHTWFNVTICNSLDTWKVIYLLFRENWKQYNCDASLSVFNKNKLIDPRQFQIQKCTTKIMFQLHVWLLLWIHTNNPSPSPKKKKLSTPNCIYPQCLCSKLSTYVLLSSEDHSTSKTSANSKCKILTSSWVANIWPPMIDSHFASENVNIMLNVVQSNTRVQHISQLAPNAQVSVQPKSTHWVHTEQKTAWRKNATVYRPCSNNPSVLLHWLPKWFIKQR